MIAGYADFTAEQLRDLAAGGDQLDAVRADVGQIQAAAQQAIRVTRQLLVFARGEAAAKREVSNSLRVSKSMWSVLLISSLQPYLLLTLLYPWQSKHSLVIEPNQLFGFYKTAVE